MADAVRSPLIYGRIYRELERVGYKFDAFQKEQIYDEMRMAQDEIIAFVGLEKLITVTLVTSTAEYAITSSGKVVVKNIKALLLPDDWEESFEMVTVQEWNDVLLAEYETAQPLKGVIIQNAFKVFPIPDSTYNGDIITLVADLQAATTALSQTVEPELPSIFDKEIEWLTLYFITGDTIYFEKYQESINRKQGLSHVQGNEITVKTAEW